MSHVEDGVLDVRYPDRFYIDGKWVGSSSGSSFEVISPSSEERYLLFAEAREQEVERAVASARRAFDHGPWPRLTHRERGALLTEFAKGLSERSDVLARIWTSEVGAIATMANAFASSVGGVFDYYASLADSFAFEEIHVPQAGGHTGLLVREPVGVVGAIIPWNGALGLIAYKLAPALLAGCTVILKSSPEAPGSGYIIAEIAEAIGIPPGVINVITADREVSEYLVRHPDVDKVTFTGSSAAGKKVGAICGERIARCTLELGGKSAAILFDDYDVEVAAASLASTASLLAGQVCSSLTRVIVSRHRHDELVDALGAAMRDIRVGDPFDPETGMGPLAMARQRDRVEHYIGVGRSEGARLAAGGGRPKHLNRGFFIEPTVFADVANDMTIAREEIFGPVLCVIPADSEEQAVEIANDTVFGLNASIFSNDVDRVYRAARHIRSGTVGHNGWRTDFSIAFGGFKQSGIGREGGREGLLPFLETKTVILDAEPSHV